MRPNILILDAHTSAALACIRSLSQLPVHLHVASPRITAHSFFSRYARKTFCYPNPEQNTARFIEWLKPHLQKNYYQVVLPLTESTLLPISKYRAELPPVASQAIPSAEAIEKTFHKEKTRLLAQQVGIAVPQSVLISSVDQIRSHSFHFPVVVKEPATGNLQEGKVRSGRGISYPANFDNFKKVIQERLQVAPELLVQEFIAGEGVGISYLMTPQGPIAPFAHRRIVEAHPTGSRAVLAESIAVPPDLFKKTVDLLHLAHFVGPVMFEFKRQGEKWVLLEINGRFWGSLSLPISCGIDFPLLFYYWLTGQPLQIPNTFLKKRVHYLLGYAEYVLRTFKGKPQGWPTTFPSRISAIFNFVQELGSGHPDFSFCAKDPLPGFVEIVDRFFSVLQKIKNR